MGLSRIFSRGTFRGNVVFAVWILQNMKQVSFHHWSAQYFKTRVLNFLHFMVKTEIPFPSENLGKPMDKMQEQYEKAVDVLQIQGLLGKSIFDLSSGEKQKVAIASIYMVGVGIYVLDEPSANLDSEGTEQLRQVLKSLKEQGNTIIISEHKLYYLNGLTDRVLIMKDGKIDKEMEGRVFDRQTAEWFTRHGLRKSDLALITPKSTILLREMSPFK